MTAGAGQGKGYDGYPSIGRIGVTSTRHCFMATLYKLVFGILLTVAVLAFLRFHVLAGKKQDSASAAAALRRSLKVGYLPVTCHLTCPVTDYASKTTLTTTNFESQRFSDFPTVVSALQSKKLQATFLLAPLAMKLREDGVPIKVCYLGHRDGSQLIVRKSSKAKDLHDLKGKKIAIPSYYSNQHFVLLELVKKQGLSPGDLNFVPLPPPDMPTALAAGAIDAYFVGEPYCAKAEMENIGRVLYYSRDIWPDFISCVLVVHEDLIREQPEVVKDLVRGIAESGAWADTHRAQAATLAASYFRQDPQLLHHVLTAQPRRVSYTNLAPRQQELDKIAQAGVEMGFLKKRLPLSSLIDTTFIPESVAPAAIRVNQ